MRKGSRFRYHFKIILLIILILLNQMDSRFPPSPKDYSREPFYVFITSFTLYNSFNISLNLIDLESNLILLKTLLALKPLLLQLLL